MIMMPGFGGFFRGSSAAGLSEARRGDERDLDHGNQLPAQEDVTFIVSKLFVTWEYDPVE